MRLISLYVSRAVVYNNKSNALFSLRSKCNEEKIVGDDLDRCGGCDAAHGLHAVPRRRGKRLSPSRCDR